MKVCRRATFNAAHRLFRPDWSDEKNNAVFGKCNNPNYHGHNYTLEVWIDGEIDPETGYLIDLKLVKNLIGTEVQDRFDHRNLNLDCPEFANLNPTAENIAVVIWNLLRAKLESKYGLSVKLWETQNNIIEYDGKWVLLFFGTAETCAFKTTPGYTKPWKITRLSFQCLFLTTRFWRPCLQTTNACCSSIEKSKKSRKNIALSVPI